MTFFWFAIATMVILMGIATAVAVIHDLKHSDRIEPSLIPEPLAMDCTPWEEDEPVIIKGRTMGLGYSIPLAPFKFRMSRGSGELPLR